MNKQIFLACLITTLLTAIPLASAIELKVVNTEINKLTSKEMKTGAEQRNKSDKTKNQPIDGITSASVLSAQRSHAVSKHDETSLSIFLGLIVLCVIGFFLKPFK